MLFNSVSRMFRELISSLLDLLEWPNSNRLSYPMNRIALRLGTMYDKKY